MPEEHLQHPEQQPRAEQAEQLAGSLENQHHLEKLQAEAMAAAEKSEVNLDKLTDEAKHEAKSTAETTLEQPSDVSSGSDSTSLGTQQALKNDSYSRKLQQVRSQLSPVQRRLSRIIHQPVVDGVSEAAGSTMFRSSGIIGGSVAALVGSLILVYSAKHYGFRYNYLLFFLLFAGGFVIGLFLELLIRLAQRRH